MKTENKVFIHLRNYTQYSLSRGALRINDIVEFCKQNNQPAATISDFNNIFGAMEFSISCRNSGIQPIIGCNINFVSQEYTQGNLLLIVKTEEGYLNLSKILSKAYLKNSNGQSPFANFDDLNKNKKGLICLAGGCSGLVTKNFSMTDLNRTEKLISKLHNIFEDNFFHELQRIDQINDDYKIYENFILNNAYTNRIPLVATNENYFLKKSFKYSHDILLCISQQKYFDDEDREVSNENFFLKEKDLMIKLYCDIPEACTNTSVLAKKCSFILEESEPMLPKFDFCGTSENKVIKEKSLQGLNKRMSLTPKISPMKEHYLKRLNYELEVIISMGYSSYFLIVSDFILWAKKNHIPVGPGRGSGAGSLVAWCLYITNLDPIEFGLLFERFLNPERVSLPDFDIDFCMDRRDDVINYVQDKYGVSNVAQIITFGSFQARAAIRDVGRVTQFPLKQTDEICKMIPFNPAQPKTLSEYIQENNKLETLIKNDPDIKKLFNISLNLEGLLRHTSTHAAGIVISDKPIEKILPLYKDSKSDLPITQFSMKYVEKIGLIKFDFLGLKTLTVIEETIRCLRLRKIKINLEEIPLNDFKTFKLLKEGLTTGIFQLEGQGMKETITKIKPDKFEELIAIVSLYRPGPMDNIPLYISRKQGVQNYNYIHEDLKEILDETYGIMVYQEQVMLIAQRLAGFSLSKADLLRRAMGKKIKSEMIAQKVNFVNGCVENNIDKNKAEILFNEIEKFAGYGFNKSHAAAYAMIAYQTAYLKSNFPLEFLCSLMNSEIGNFEKLAIYCSEVRQMGFSIFNPDVNISTSKFEVVYKKNLGVGINFGLGAIKNIGEMSIQKLVSERKVGGKFESLVDLLQRVDNSVLNRRVFEALINSGALDSLEKNQKYLEEKIDLILNYNVNYHKNFSQNQSGLFETFDKKRINFDSSNYINLELTKKLQKEFDAFGFYLTDHPTKYYHDLLNQHLVKIDSINNGNNLVTVIEGKIYSCLGLIESFNERLSKNGKKFAFLNFSDFSGHADAICFSETLETLEVYPNLGDICLIKFSVQSFKDKSRVVVQSLKKLDYENDNNMKFEVDISLENLDYQKLSFLLNQNSNGKNKFSFSIMHQNYLVKVNCDKLIKADLNFLLKLKEINGVNKINSIF